MHGGNTGSASICCLAVASTIWSGSGQRRRASDRDRLNAATACRHHRPKVLRGDRSRALTDVGESIRRIKSQDGPTSSSRQLHADIDVLEQGLRTTCRSSLRSCWARETLCGGNPGTRLELVSTQPTPSGVILSTYKVAGRLRTDRLPANEPTATGRSSIVLSRLPLGHGISQYPHSELRRPQFRYQRDTDDRCPPRAARRLHDLRPIDHCCS